jgi:hypothetical protein
VIGLQPSFSLHQQQLQPSWRRQTSHGIHHLCHFPVTNHRHHRHRHHHHRPPHSPPPRSIPLSASVFPSMLTDTADDNDNSSVVPVASTSTTTTTTTTTTNSATVTPTTINSAATTTTTATSSTTTAATSTTNTAATSTTTVVLVHDLQKELNKEGLGLCHGLLHAHGIRKLQDLESWTSVQISEMGADSFDRRTLLRVIQNLQPQPQELQRQEQQQQQQQPTTTTTTTTTPRPRKKEATTNPLKEEEEEEEEEDTVAITTSKLLEGKSSHQKVLDEPPLSTMSATTTTTTTTTAPTTTAPTTRFALQRVVISKEEDELSSSSSSSMRARKQQPQQHDIFTGRLLSKETCQEMNRLAEQYAYQGIGTIGAGWTNELYTLTDLHMHCKDIPGFMQLSSSLSSTTTTTPSSSSSAAAAAETTTLQTVFDDLFQALYPLFTKDILPHGGPGPEGQRTRKSVLRIRPNSIRLESDGEPHLIKYHHHYHCTKAKGTVLHTDENYKGIGAGAGAGAGSQPLAYSSSLITINVVLSDPADFTGGGTYIPSLNNGNENAAAAAATNKNTAHNHETDRNGDDHYRIPPSPSTIIHLQQGEMLIHMGDLEHSGVDITSGVRRLLIAFLACEWEEEDDDDDDEQNEK